jgi:molybdenum cofactor cytidylyltransferase
VSNANSARVFGIIPAAGASQRMGRPKQLLPWDDSTILESTITHVLDGGVGGLVVVTNSTVSAALKLADTDRHHTVVLDDPDAEMLDSIIAGVVTLRTVYQPADDDAFLVCPGDLPRMTADIVHACVIGYRAHSGQIVAAAAGNRPRHPLVVPFALAEALPQLHGIGLRGLLDRHGNILHTINIADSPAVQDVDTPDDYELLRIR